MPSESVQTAFFEQQCTARIFEPNACLQSKTLKATINNGGKFRTHISALKLAEAGRYGAGVLGGQARAEKINALLFAAYPK